MQIKDPVQWAQQEVELQADDASRQFLAFFQQWFATADEQIEDQGQEPVNAMRWALADTEQQLGFLAMEWIGQMLLLASMHWEFGDAMVSGMTNLEKRMVEQMTAIKLVELQETAAGK